MENLMVVIDDDNKVRIYLVDRFGDIIEELDSRNFTINFY